MLIRGNNPITEIKFPNEYLKIQSLIKQRQVHTLMYRAIYHGINEIINVLKLSKERNLDYHLQYPLPMRLKLEAVLAIDFDLAVPMVNDEKSTAAPKAAGVNSITVAQLAEEANVLVQVYSSLNESNVADIPTKKKILEEKLNAFNRVNQALEAWFKKNETNILTLLIQFPFLHMLGSIFDAFKEELVLANVYHTFSNQEKSMPEHILASIDAVAKKINSLEMKALEAEQKIDARNQGIIEEIKSLGMSQKFGQIRNLNAKFVEDKIAAYTNDELRKMHYANPKVVVLREDQESFEYWMCEYHEKIIVRTQLQTTLKELVRKFELSRVDMKSESKNVDPAAHRETKEKRTIEKTKVDISVLTDKIEESRKKMEEIIYKPIVDALANLTDDSCFSGCFPNTKVTTKNDAFTEKYRNYDHSRRQGKQELAALRLEIRELEKDLNSLNKLNDSFKNPLVVYINSDSWDQCMLVLRENSLSHRHNLVRPERAIVYHMLIEKTPLLDITSHDQWIMKMYEQLTILGDKLTQAGYEKVFIFQFKDMVQKRWVTLQSVDRQNAPHDAKDEKMIVSDSMSVSLSFTEKQGEIFSLHHLLGDKRALPVLTVLYSVLSKIVSQENLEFLMDMFDLDCISQEAKFNLPVKPTGLNSVTDKVLPIITQQNFQSIIDYYFKKIEGSYKANVNSSNRNAVESALIRSMTSDEIRVPSSVAPPGSADSKADHKNAGVDFSIFASSIREVAQVLIVSNLKTNSQAKSINMAIDDYFKQVHIDALKEVLALLETAKKQLNFTRQFTVAAEQAKADDKTINYASIEKAIICLNNLLYPVLTALDSKNIETAQKNNALLRDRAHIQKTLLSIVGEIEVETKNTDRLKELTKQIREIAVMMPIPINHRRSRRDGVDAEQKLVHAHKDSHRTSLTMTSVSLEHAVTTPSALSAATAAAIGSPTPSPMLVVPAAGAAIELNASSVVVDKKSPTGSKYEVSEHMSGSGSGSPVLFAAARIQPQTTLSPQSATFAVAPPTKQGFMTTG